MKFTSILAACAMVLAISTVHAEDIVPDVLMQPAMSSVPGRTIDIKGLLPGMTTDEARAILTDILGAEPGESREQTVLSQSGIMVKSVPFTKWLSGTVDGEKISTMYSGFASGNQLVLVSREAEYSDSTSAPMFDAFMAGLLEKYGEPSFRKDWAEAAALIWTFKDGQLVPCDPSGSPQCLEPTSAFSNLRASSQAFDVIIYAAVSRARRDIDRVGQFKMSSTDLSIMAPAEIADKDGLRPALDALVAASAASAPKPTF